MKTNKFLILLMLIFITISCSEDFLDNPPEDSLVVDNFFNTDEQVFASGSALYGFPWFYFGGEKFILALDTYAGNAVGSYSDLNQFEDFAMTKNNQFMSEGWESLYNVIATSNSLLNNLETKVSSDVSQEMINNVKGEAHFMRATAYFYLVRLWGPVPIIHKMEQYANIEPAYRNNVDDIYQFIINDYAEAQKLLPNKWPSAVGRVQKSTTDAFLAKVYLTRKDYANAKMYAEKVIDAGQYRLMDNYGDVFRPQYNNNVESIFALQWIGCSEWGYGSTHQAYLAANSKLTGFGSGWGTFQPSIELINSYEDGDLRKHETVMAPGDFYDDLVTSEGGYAVPDDGLTSTLAGFRKYVVGPTGDTSVEVCQMRTGLNTPLMRFSDVLLIHAESILGTQASTADAAALESYNAVRVRAGLNAKNEITISDILKERQVEFVLEGDYWMDLARMNRADAINIIANQERGTYNNRDIDDVNSKMVSPSENDFLLPIPGAESDTNPNLLEAPVAFEF